MRAPTLRVVGYVSPSVVSDVVPLAFYAGPQPPPAGACLSVVTVGLRGYAPEGVGEQLAEFEEALRLLADRGAAAVVLGGSILGMLSTPAELYALERRWSAEAGVEVRAEAGLLREDLDALGCRRPWVVHRFADVSDDDVARLLGGGRALAGTTSIPAAPAGNARTQLTVEGAWVEQARTGAAAARADAVVALGGTWPVAYYLDDLTERLGLPVANNIASAVRFLHDRCADTAGSRT